MYSFGIILWELITGEIPPMMDLNESLGVKRNLPVVAIAANSPEIAQLISSCTAGDPDSRPRSSVVVEVLNERARVTDIVR